MNKFKILIFGSLLIFLGRSVESLAATCTVPVTHPTISAAINDPSCNLITLKFGLYLGNITATINSARHITIDGKHLAVINPTGLPNGVNFKVTFTGSAGVVELRNLIFDGKSTVNTSGIVVTGGNLIVADSTIKYYSNYGVQSIDAPDVSIQRTTLANNGTSSYSALQISSAARASLVDSKFSSNDGGAINVHNWNAEPLIFTMDKTELVENYSPDQALHFDGNIQATITKSNIHENKNINLGTWGSAIGFVNLAFNYNMKTSSLIIDGSSVTDNDGPNAPALWTYGLSSVEIDNSTIANNNNTENQSIFLGYSNAAVTLQESNANINNTTLANNTCTFSPPKPCLVAGLSLESSQNKSATISNSIFFGQSGDQCLFQNVAVVSGGGNIDGGVTCNLFLPTDMVLTDPLLGPLSTVGTTTTGITFALTPQLGSPAIDHGLNASCEPLDQSGTTRPKDGNNDNIASCETGAIEIK